VAINTKCEMPNFTHSKDVIGAQKLKMGHVTLTSPITGSFVIARLTLDIACAPNLRL